VARIARIEVTVVNTESEALLLESNLIKAHRPRYNILLRDDKSFPYILCQAGHEFPRLVFYRGPRQRGSRQFGPFPSASSVKEVLQHLQKVFRIRNCRDSFFANRSRPCLQFQIGRCSAPCVGLIDRDSYARDVEGAIGVLEGRNLEVVAELQRRMEAAAASLQFENAARLRDQLRELQEIRAQQIANAQRPTDIDVVAIAGEPGAVRDLRAAGARGPESRNRQLLSGQRAQRAGRNAGRLPDALLQLARRRRRRCSSTWSCPTAKRSWRRCQHRGPAAAAARAAARTGRSNGSSRRRRTPAMRCACGAHRPSWPRGHADSGARAAFARTPRAHRMLRCQSYRRRGHGGLLRGVRPGRRAQARLSALQHRGVTPGDDYAAMHQALRRHAPASPAVSVPGPICC
jgi:excinuclease ABC subunit C